VNGWKRIIKFLPVFLGYEKMRKVIYGNKFEKNNYLEGNMQIINSFCYKYGETECIFISEYLKYCAIYIVFRLE